QEQLVRVVALILGWIEIPLIIVLADIYVTLVFSQFTWTQSWSWRLQQFAIQVALRVLAGLGSALPGLLAIAAILILFRWLTAVSDRLFQGVEEGRVRLWGLHPDLARPTRRLVTIGLWVIGAAAAFPFIPGSSSKAFQGMSVLIGIAVSLGSTSIIGNIVAGIALTYSRAFKIGDLIKVGEHLGVVQSLGTLATKLRSVRNEEITIPNGQLAGSSIENYTRLAKESGLILHTQVTIGYDAEWRKVHALLIEAALRVEGIERDPAPWVYQRSLNDSHITYELCCVTRSPVGLLKYYSDLHGQIQDAFSRAGVEILSPAYHAVRDANAPVLPDEPAGPRAAPGGFRLRPGG
ncbi:MAG TPA: mechanosensitive ion channel family protein, partial [Candidatus Eisenbacteria bacterium]